MKALVTIPHFFKPKPGSVHGSHSMMREQRAAMLESTLYGFIDLFETGGGLIDRRNGISLLPANRDVRIDMQFAVCIHGDDHLLDLLPAALRRRILVVQVEDDPRMLGFACHRVLAGQIGRYDWYGFVEDDTGISDRSFFDKLAAVNALDPALLLLPNRYERPRRRPNAKIYVDGPALLNSRDEGLMALFTGDREYRFDHLGRSIRLRKVTNPHAGCFFLSDRQMRVFADSAAFHERSTAYISPLESSATLSMLRTFDVYKPARENADFLELEHLGGAEIDKLNIVIGD